MNTKRLTFKCQQYLSKQWRYYEKVFLVCVNKATTIQLHTSTCVNVVLKDTINNKQVSLKKYTSTDIVNNVVYIRVYSYIAFIFSFGQIWNWNRVNNILVIITQNTFFCSICWQHLENGLMNGTFRSGIIGIYPSLLWMVLSDQVSLVYTSHYYGWYFQIGYHWYIHLTTMDGNQ